MLRENENSHEGPCNANTEKFNSTKAAFCSKLVKSNALNITKYPVFEIQEVVRYDNIQVKDKSDDKKQYLWDGMFC